MCHLGPRSWCKTSLKAGTVCLARKGRIRGIQRHFQRPRKHSQQISKPGTLMKRGSTHGRITASGPMADDRTTREEPAAPDWHELPHAFRACAVRSPNAILLETAKPDGKANRSFLFLEPHEELTAWAINDLDPLLAKADRHLSAGAFAAGFFSYECGNHFVGGAAKSLPAATGKPLAWLGIFKRPIEFNHSTGRIRGTLPPVEVELPPPPSQPSISAAELEIHPKEYLARFERIQEYLHAGDTYQVNFTDRIRGIIASNPLAIYEHLLKQQPVPFAALIHRPSGMLMSFSPELFFHLSGRHITVRPMKGTWPRGRDSREDAQAQFQLVHDGKNRSEHVMIVDLLRNDLGRICEFGSIKVESLFQAERYKTLFQMTSTISGDLRSDLTPSAVIKNLFPSGSVTGAPKRRTMEIIRELEDSPRGIYTGSIGYFGPSGESCFNVAIRTLELSGNTFCFGVGGGITAGSDGDEEYQECRLKAAFLTRQVPPFSLIETMRCERGIPLLDLHWKRLTESAEYFDIRFDRQRLLSELTQTARECGSARSRVRVELDADGHWTIAASPLVDVPWGGRLLLAEERVSSKDVFRRHKTTNRRVLDEHLQLARTAGFDEVMFLNEQAALTECATSNVFLRIQGRWSTPSLSQGVLPGVYRAILLDSLGSVTERELHLEDVGAAEEVIVCNALRGVRTVGHIETSDGSVVWSGPVDAAAELPFGSVGASEILNTSGPYRKEQ